MENQTYSVRQNTLLDILLSEGRLRKSLESKKKSRSLCYYLPLFNRLLLFIHLFADCKEIVGNFKYYETEEGRM